MPGALKPIGGKGKSVSAKTTRKILTEQGSLLVLRAALLDKDGHDRDVTADFAPFLTFNRPKLGINVRIVFKAGGAISRAERQRITSLLEENREEGDEVLPEFFDKCMRYLLIYNADDTEANVKTETNTNKVQSTKNSLIICWCM